MFVSWPSEFFILLALQQVGMTALHVLEHLFDSVMGLEGRPLLPVSVKKNVLFHPWENCLAAVSKMAWERAENKEMGDAVSGG